MAFSAQIEALLLHLHQHALACGPEPTPDQELQLFRAQCAVYEEIFTRDAQALGDQAPVRVLALSALPSMEDTARTLHAFERELTEHEPYSALLAPARELLAQLSECIRAIKARHRLPDAHA